MEELFYECIEEVEATGALNLLKRKQIWKECETVSHEQNVNSRKVRKQLAIECIKKIIKDWNINSMPETIKNNLTILIQEIERKAEFKNSLEIFRLECEKEIIEKDNFCIAYLQQAVKHLIKIVNDDEPLLSQEYNTIDSDEKLDFDELDTSYCCCITWKYQMIQSNEFERRNRERTFWIWYIEKAADIQGKKIEYRSKLINAHKIEEKKKCERKIRTIEEFTKEINGDFEYIGCEKKSKIVTISVLNLYDNPICPVCGQIANRNKDFIGMAEMGKIKNWKVQFKVKERLYFCDNTECDKINFISKSPCDYKEKKANFINIKSIPENEEVINELFNNA